MSNEFKITQALMMTSKAEGQRMRNVCTAIDVLSTDARLKPIDLSMAHLAWAIKSNGYILIVERRQVDVNET